MRRNLDLQQQKKLTQILCGSAFNNLNAMKTWNVKPPQKMSFSQSAAASIGAIFLLATLRKSMPGKLREAIPYQGDVFSSKYCIVSGWVFKYMYILRVWLTMKGCKTHTHMFIALLLFLADSFPKIMLFWLCYLLSPSYSKLPGGILPGAKAELTDCPVSRKRASIKHWPLKTHLASFNICSA